MVEIYLPAGAERDIGRSAGTRSRPCPQWVESGQCAGKLHRMDDWFKQGCEICRQGVLSGSSSSPALVGTSIANHARLRRCHACGSWWEENEREAHVISEADALRTFKDLF